MSYWFIGFYRKGKSIEFDKKMFIVKQYNSEFDDNTDYQDSVWKDAQIFSSFKAAVYYLKQILYKDIDSIDYPVYKTYYNKDSSWVIQTMDREIIESKNDDITKIDELIQEMKCNGEFPEYREYIISEIICNDSENLIEFKESEL